MAKDENKVTVSMSIDPPLLAEVNAAIDAAKKIDRDIDFSKWMRDAVRRKLRQFRMRESAVKYRAKLQWARVITDPAGRVLFINDAFTKMCGYTLEQLRGKKPGSVLQGPATEKGIVKDFRLAIRKRRPFECTLTNYRADGHAYRVHIKMRPIFKNQKLVQFEALENIA